MICMVQCFFENCGIYAQSGIQSKNANLTGHITYEIFNNYHIFSVPAIQKDWTKNDNQRYDLCLIALFILVVISYKWSAKVYCLYLRTKWWYKHWCTTSKDLWYKKYLSNFTTLSYSLDHHVIQIMNNYHIIK